MPHGITQCYLPPGRADIPALTPAEAGTRFSDPGGMKASELELVEWRPSAAGKVTAGTESRWPGALVRSNHYELEACDKDMISRRYANLCSFSLTTKLLYAVVQTRKLESLSCRVVLFV